MFRIDTPDATSDHKFTEGDPTIPIEATTVSADWLNSVQEELVSVLEHVGITPDKESTEQLRTAIVQMIEQRIPIATATEPGLVQPDGYTVSITSAGLLSVVPMLAEFKDFFEQIPPQGWAVRDGTVLQGADTSYPMLWEHLRSSDNLWKCKTEAQWLALSTTAGGIGGVPFFVVDEAAKTIKLPDTRTDHSYGFSGSSVGQWEGDAMRNITGSIDSYINIASASGAFQQSNYAQGIQAVDGSKVGYHQAVFNASRVVPTASQFRPRRFSLLPCVYVGGIN